MDDLGFFGLFGALAGFLALAALIVFAVSVVPLWLLFRKLGYPGWWSLIPFFNFFKLAEAAGRPGFWGLCGILGAIPVVGWIAALVVMFLINQDLARSFGKDPAWAILLTFLPWFGWLILALGSDEYQGPAGPEPHHYKRAV